MKDGGEICPAIGCYNTHYISNVSMFQFPRMSKGKIYEICHHSYKTSANNYVNYIPYYHPPDCIYSKSLGLSLVRISVINADDSTIEVTKINVSNRMGPCTHSLSVTVLAS